MQKTQGQSGTLPLMRGSTRPRAPPTRRRMPATTANYPGSEGTKIRQNGCWRGNLAAWDRVIVMSDEPSLDELRAVSERTRKALASTVDELRGRLGDSATEIKTLVSPSHIKEEVRNYVSRERKILEASLRQKATENPLQLAAIGAALAYPGWRLLRAIPMPLLMIGAGLFLTSKKGQQSTQAATARIGEVVQQGAERVSDATVAFGSNLSDRVGGARSTAAGIRDTMASASGAAIETARSTLQDASGIVKNVVGKFPTSADVEKASATVKEGVALMGDRIGAASTASRDSIGSVINDNALLVAGIGAALGALIAASLPASETENRVFGAGSQTVKAKARQAAGQGIEKVGVIAAEAAGSVASAAAREGLDASGIQHALNTVADSVRAVADRGLDTALGAAPELSEQSFTERVAS